MVMWLLAVGVAMAGYGDAEGTGWPNFAERELHP
jgi:hypothetical protein